MKTNNWKSRDNKRNKRINGMRVSGKSVFLLQEIAIKKAQKINEGR